MDRNPPVGRTNAPRARSLRFAAFAWHSGGDQASPEVRSLPNRNTGLILVGLLSLALGGPAGAATTIDWRFYDFFNVAPGEWWDARLANYGEAPIGKECFTAAGVANGVCTPIQPAVDDLAAYPYTYWSGGIYASHRIDVDGVEVPGYTLSEPVFLPVLNSGEAAGSMLQFDWSADFIDTA